MSDLEKAARQALEALEGVLNDSPKVREASITGGLYEVVQCREAITALRQVLEQTMNWQEIECPCCGELARAFPPTQPREWVGLTDEDIDTWNIVGHESLREFVRAIEAKLRSKNGY
jgi:hypothetical protein